MNWWDDFFHLDERPEKNVPLTPRQIAILVSGLSIVAEAENWSDYDVWYDTIDAEISAIVHKLTVADS